MELTGLIPIGVVTLIVLFVVIIIGSHMFYLVRQSEAIVMERLGQFHKVLQPGVHMVVPFIDQPRKIQWTYEEDVSTGKVARRRYTTHRIDMREGVYDFPKQNVITKDNVTMEINALLYYQIVDPKAAVYEFDNLSEGIEKLTQTTLRNVIGSMDLDESLASRDHINQRLRVILDEATDKWGVKVNRVELQEIKPPQDIKQAMEKQMRAERDRRAEILKAEGEKRSAVLRAEGDKESAVLEAQGEAESRQIKAQAEADARLQIAKADAEALSAIGDTLPAGTDPSQFLIASQYIKALPQMTDGHDNKLIVVPYEASSLMGSLSSIKELFGASGELSNIGSKASTSHQSQSQSTVTGQVHPSKP